MKKQEHTILPTKICAPPLFQKIVPRPRLIDQLISGLQYKVNLISAPAGYGKTTLASEFYHSQKMPCAWLTLDRDDNDPVRFWSYFISALQTIQPDIRMPTFQIPATTGSTPERTMLTALIKEITERTSDLKTPCNFILDQYDVIENQSIHNGLIFLIENLPVKMHLLITTRVESFFPLARYRGRGQVNEIRYEDLRFNREEMKSFLNEIMGFNLNDGDIEALEARTEGWITSLRMAALSMTKQISVNNFIKSIS
jgi:LuxR family transcriptional regulator, maltose regulon positive regulatory protein